MSDERDADRPRAICDRCGESHDDGACWDDDGDAAHEEAADEPPADADGDPWPNHGGGPTTEYGPGDLVKVDFDGTLTQGEALWWEGETESPNEAVCEWTRQQYYAGAHVVIWTARPWSQANIVAARLTEWGIPYHGIRCEKGAADGYVDDKAARPEEVLADGPRPRLALTDESHDDGPIEGRGDP